MGLMGRMGLMGLVGFGCFFSFALAEPIDDCGEADSEGCDFGVGHDPALPVQMQKAD
jgi:hypothetical protein